MGVMSEDARLRYLDEASKALTFASPVVSSFMNASRKTLTAVGTGTDAGTNDVCTGCAQSVFPGLTGDVLRSIKTKRTRQDRLSGNNNREQHVRCSMCGTENKVTRLGSTRSKHSARPESVRKLVHRELKHQSESAHQTPPVIASTPTATSTQQSTTIQPATTQTTTPARRKARGKNASLQALLANKKPDAPKKTYGDLMDFMKT